MTAIRGPLDAWRVFTLDGEQLRPPFALWQWADALRSGDDWQPGSNLARCLVEEHRVPSEACSCGLYAVRDLGSLLAAATVQKMTGSPLPVLEDCGVLARVRLDGLILPGPEDQGDPDGTVRASAAKLTELWVHPRYGPKVEALQVRYGVPTAVAEDWTDADPQVRLWPALSRRPFGSLPLSSPEVREVLTGIARSVAEGVRGGMTRSDAARGLYDSPAQPSWQQARHFVDAAALVLAAEVAHDFDAHLATAPLAPFEDIARRADKLGRMFGQVG